MKSLMQWRMMVVTMVLMIMVWGGQGHHLNPSTNRGKSFLKRGFGWIVKQSRSKPLKDLQLVLTKTTILAWNFQIET